MPETRVALPLDRLQRWMQAVVAAPGTPDEALAAPEAARELPPRRLREVVLPSATLTPAERVGVYQGMYLLRMRDALASDYPGVAHFLGDEGFAELVRGYVAVHPSRSYTLNRLGDHLPEYLLAAPGIARGRFLHDLARLELAITQAFDEEETPPLTADEVARVPAEAWTGARLVPVAAFRLLALDYPAGDYLESVRNETAHPAVRRRAAWAAVYRRDYSVRRIDLVRAQFDLLQALASGRPLGEAIEEAVVASRGRADEERLFRWFRDWIAAGLFRAVEWRPAAGR